MIEQTPRKANPWAALFRVITEPTATFESFGERPAIFPGYLVQMILSLALPIGMMGVMDALLQQQFAAMPAPPPEAAMTIAKWSALAGQFGGALAGPWIAGLIVAALAMLVGNFHGGSRPYGAYLGMIGYARIPVALGQVILGFLMTQATTMEALQSMSGALSLAAFLPEGSSPLLMGIAGAINPFDIWYYILLAIGFATLHRTKPSRAYALPLILFLITALMAAGSGAIASKFTPGM